MRTVSFFSALLLTACVTINIYFPAAAAEKVADEIIKGIQTEEAVTKPLEKDLTPQSNLDGFQRVVTQLGNGVLNIIVPTAHAAGADLSVDTASIRALRSAMHKRFSSLAPYYSKGLIGITKDGLIVARGDIPLRDKNKLNKLVSAENSDRSSLYKEIANANGHSEWFGQIQSTFAVRWVSHAKPGWWYQSSNGSWKQK